jgi:hypothetical protein
VVDCWIAAVKSTEIFHADDCERVGNALSNISRESLHMAKERAHKEQAEKGNLSRKKQEERVHDRLEAMNVREELEQSKQTHDL